MNRRIIRLLSIMLVLAMAFSLTTPAYASDSTENGAAVTETAGNDNPAGGDPDDRDYAGDSPDDEDPAAGDPEYEEPGDADTGEDDPGGADPADGSGGRDPADGEEETDVSAQTGDDSDAIPEEPAETDEDELSVAGEYQGSISSELPHYIDYASAYIRFSYSADGMGSFIIKILVSPNEDLSDAQAYYSADMGAGNVSAQITIDNLSPYTTYYYRAVLIHSGDGVVVAEEAEIKSFVTEQGPNTCGDDLYWRFEGLKGILMISGTGDMYAFRSPDEVPWPEWRPGIQSVRIEKGATGIGSFAFSECHSLTSISIPASVLVIGEEAFSGCDALAEIYYGGTPEEWSAITVEDGNSALTDGSAEIHFPGEPARTEFTTDAELRECLATINPFAQTTLTYTGEADTFTIEQDLDFGSFKGTLYMNGKYLMIPEGVTVGAEHVTINGMPYLYVDGTLIAGNMSPWQIYFGENSRLIVRGTLSTSFGLEGLSHVTVDTESDYAYLNWDLNVSSEEELRRAAALLPSLRKTYCTLWLRSADEISLSADLMIPEFEGRFELNAVALTIPAGVTVTSDTDIYLEPYGRLAVDGTLVNNRSVSLSHYAEECCLFTNGGGHITGTGRISISALPGDSLERFFYGFNLEDFLIQDLRNDGRIGACLLYPNTALEALHFYDEEGLREIVANWTEGAKRVEYESDAPLLLTRDLVLPEGLQLYMKNGALHIETDVNVTGLSVTAARYLMVAGTLALNSISGKTEIKLFGTLDNRGTMEIPKYGSLSVNGVLINNGTIRLQGSMSVIHEGQYMGDGPIIIPKTGSYPTDFVAHITGPDPEEFTVTSNESEWELVQLSFPTDRHWVYSAGVVTDDNGDPLISGTEATVKVRYYVDPNDVGHTTSPRKLLLFFLSTDPDFWKTQEGLDEADNKAAMIETSDPSGQAAIGLPNTVSVNLSELVPNTSYYYVVHLVDPETTDTLAVTAEDNVRSFTTADIAVPVITVDETCAGEVVSFTPTETGIYALTPVPPVNSTLLGGTIRVRDARGVVLAEDVKSEQNDTDLYTVFLAQAGRQVYIYPSGQMADELGNPQSGAARYFPVKLEFAASAAAVPDVFANGDSVYSMGSRAVRFTAPLAGEYTVTGISTMGNLAVADLNRNSQDWIVCEGNMVRLTLSAGEQVFLKWNGNPTKTAEFAVTDQDHDIMTLVSAVDTAGSAEDIRTAMQGIYQGNPGSLRRMMQINDAGVITAIREREESAAGGSTDVVITPEAGKNFSAVKMLGASLNNTRDGGPAILVVDKAKQEHAVPAGQQFKVLQFSLTLKNIDGDTGTLAFPITVDLKLNRTGVDRNELVFYHFHDGSSDPEIVTPNVYVEKASGDWYAKLYLTGLSDFALAYMGDDSDEPAESTDIVVPMKEIRLDRDYLAMEIGDTVQLNTVTADAAWLKNVEWTVENIEGENVITVDAATGVVTAQNKGTAYAVANIAWLDGTTAVKRCRVDVTEAGLVVGSFRLLTAKATVELYKTDYTRIQVIPELDQIAPAAVTPTILPPEEYAPDSGSTIKKAWLEDVKPDAKAAPVGEVFLLRVKDDRTLEIVPTEGALTGALKTKGSYQANVWVQFGEQDEQSVIAGTLNLTVKKTVPKLSAKAVKLNSFYDETQQLVFTGSIPERVRPDDSKANPEWIDFDAQALTVTYNSERGGHNAKHSGKLFLLVKVQGWAVQLPVTVSVSAAKSAPKITPVRKTVTLQPKVGDSAEVACLVTPSVFADAERFPIDVSIYEGNKPLVKGEELTVSVRDQSVTVSEGSKASEISGQHTYKVQLSIAGEKPVVLTVKRLAEKVRPKLTVKASGTIDLAVDYSPVTFAPTLQNTGDPKGYEITSILDSEGYDRTKRFHTEGLTLTAKNGVKPGKHIAIITAFYGNSGEVSKSIPFTVKQSAKPPAAGVTLKATGSIDVIRPESSIVVTPTIKNCYTHVMDASNLVICRGTGKSAVPIETADENPFKVELEGSSFRIGLKEEKTVNHLAEKYSVYMVLDNGTTSAKLPLSVKMGSAKLTQSVKTVQLLKQDRFSSGTVVIGTEDVPLSSIDWETTAAAFASTKDKNGNAYFTLQVRENGECAICYNGNEINPTVKSGTVKINVFLKGNVSGKPNAALSVKVNVL